MIFDFRLWVFHTVANRLSFTKAANELFITQPAVTKHIQELEKQFNNKLFVRRGNNIVLTEAGKALLLLTQELTAIYGKIEQEMASLIDSNKGTLHIGASTTIAQYILPAFLADFCLKFSEVSIQMVTKNTEDIEEDLLSGKIDLGFIEGHTKNKQIKYIPFFKDEIALVARVDHPLALRRSVTVADLQKVNLVMREHGSGTLEVVNLALKKAGVNLTELNIDIRLDSTEAIKVYLLHSECLAFISKHAIKGAVASSLFNIVPVKGLKIERPLSIIHLHGTPSKLAALFLKFIARYNFK